MSKGATRRNLLKIATGSIAAGLGLTMKSEPASTAAATQRGHDHKRVSGPLATAIVSFGQWPTDPPLDRNPNLSPLNRNGHQLIPHEVTIKAGGTVTFMIAGAHQVIVYDDGVEPEDIDTTMLIQPAGAPMGPAILIDDPNHRIYRGLDPSVLPLLAIQPPPPSPPGPPPFLVDRVEVVHFPKPGTYLVICGVVFHFVADNMFGFVRVLP